MAFFEQIGFFWSEYWPMFLRGTGNTLLLAMVGTIIGFGIGLLVAIVRYTPDDKKENPVKRVLIKIVKGILVVYIEVFRATPMMVQAMILYYGLMYAGIDLAPLAAGFVIISVNTGAYMAEIIRGGIISVDRGQTEGAHSLGMTHWQTMTSVVLPQAIRNIMPAIGNEFIINLKDSVVLSVISVAELFFMTKSAAGAYANYFPPFVIACIIYLVLTLVITRVLMRMEKKMDGPATFAIKEALQKRGI